MSPARATAKDALPILSRLPQGDVLLSYQRKANQMISQHALLVIEKSRRVGLTWGVAAEAVLTAAAQKASGGTNVFYISYNTDMTKDFIDACAMWAKAFNLAVGDIREELFDDGKDREAIKALSIDFASGFRIQALSSAPRSLRGKQGLIIIDEAAFVNALSELLKAAIAMLIWGGRVVVISTHQGKDNAFNQLIQEIRAGQRKGAVLTITFNDAVSQGLWDRINLVSPDTTPPKDEWIALIRETYAAVAEEELDVIPSSGAGSYIDAADIAACVHPEAGQRSLYQGGLTYLGRDIARRRDLNVTAALEDVAATLWVRELSAMRDATFADQRADFGDKMGFYRVVRAALDQTGMGEVEVELLQDLYGASVVEGYIFTGSNKLAIASALKARMEARTIMIPDDPVLHADLRSIKRTASSGDAVRLSEDGTSDAHADRFWALGLGCIAALQPYQVYAYRSPRTDRESRGRRSDTKDNGWPGALGGEKRGAW